MAIKVKNDKNVSEIYYIDQFGTTLVRRTIAYVYKGGRLLWEWITSNFFSKDSKIIVSKDGYVINGKESN